MDNVFGMGIVLNFTDNASATIVQASQNIQQLSSVTDNVGNDINSADVNLATMTMTAFGWIEAGHQMVALGERITDTFRSMAMEVINVGDDFEKTRLTLGAMYKDSDVAKQKLSWVMDYAAKTPFGIQDLKQTVVGLKAIGIEADQMVTSVSGYQQELMGYIGDLNAIRPDLSMQKISYAIRNALGGNTRSLDMTLDIKTEAVLGHKFGEGESAEQDIADLVSKMGGEGLMASLEGTWTQMLSNIEDQFVRFKLAVSDAGAFETAKNSLKKVYDAISTLSDSDLAEIGVVFKDVFETMWKPIDRIADGLSYVIRHAKEFITEYPKFFKFIAMFGTLAGSVLLVGGNFLKFAGFANLAIMSLTGRFTGLGGGVTSLMGILGKFAVGLSPIIGASAIFYTVWSKNVMGIRDNSKRFFTDILQALKVVVDAFTDNTLSTEMFDKAKELGILPLIETILDLKYRFGFFVEGFKEGWNEVAEKVAQVALGIANHLTGLDFSSIEDFFEWLRNTDPEAWKKLGEQVGKVVGWFIVFKTIISPIGGLLMKVYAGVKLLKGGFDKLKSSLSTIKGGFDNLKTALGKIPGNPLGKMSASIKTEAVIIKTTLKNMFNNLNIGGSVKSVFSKAFSGIKDVIVPNVKSSLDGLKTVVLPAVKDSLSGLKSVVGTAFSDAFGGVKNIVQNKLPQAFGNVKDIVGPSLSKAFGGAKDVIGSSLSKAFGGVKSMSGTIGSSIKDVITSGIRSISSTSIGTSLKSLFGKAFSTLASNIPTMFSTIGSAITTALGAITPAGWVAIALVALTAVVTYFWDEISSFFKDIGEKIGEFLAPAIEKIKEWFGNVWDSIKDNPVVQVISTVLGVVVANFVGFGKVVWEIFKGVWDVAVTIFNGLAPIIGGVIDVAVSLFQAGWKIVSSVFNLIYQVGRVIFLGILAVVKLVVMGVCGFIDGVGKFFGKVFTWINDNVIQPVVKFFKDAWDGAVKFVTDLVQGISDFFNTIFTWLNTNVIQPIANFFKTAWDTAIQVVKSLIQGISDFFNVIFTWLNDNVIQPVANFFKEAWDVAVTFVTDLIQGISDFFNVIFTWLNENVIQPIANFFKDAWEGAVSFVTGLIQGISDFFNTIFTWINDNVIQPFSDFFTKVFQDISDFVTPIIEGLSSGFKTAYDTVISVWEGIADWFGGLFDGVKDGVGGVIAWFEEKLGWISDTVGAIGDFFGGGIDAVGNFFSDVGDNLAEFVGLDTGGYVKEEGLAVLHPNEVVVNDDLTKNLRNFLSTQGVDEKAVPNLNSERVPELLNTNTVIHSTVSESVPTTNEFIEYNNAPTMNEFAEYNSEVNDYKDFKRYSVPTPSVSSSPVDSHDNNSVTFGQGSIVFQVQTNGDGKIGIGEMKAYAKELMEEIERLKQLKKMSVRNPRQEVI